ncbi:MAG TPA: RNA polymerase sigma factor [Polyangia bacterium]|nr:RNA polymerase sigma factor [Polyangia bacterium]
MARLVAGEEQAFRDCYELHAPRTLSLLVRMLRDRAHAEEILQETFVAVFKKIGQYRGEARLPTWISGIAVRRALNAMRDQSRRLPTLPAADSGEVAGDADAGDESALSRRDLARRLLILIDQLSDEKRVAILLYAEGYTAAEIGTLTQAPRATVLARIARGRAELLSLAERAGVDLWEDDADDSDDASQADDAGQAGAAARRGPRELTRG